MVTLGIASLLHELANSLGKITGGADGLQGIMMGPLFGRYEFDLFGRTAYLYSLSVLFILFLVARRIVRSPFGLSLRAIRDNPLRAAAAGVPIGRRLAAIYTLSGAYAGAAGVLLAQTTQFVSLDVLAFHRSADLMLVLIIGVRAISTAASSAPSASSSCRTGSPAGRRNTGSSGSGSCSCCSCWVDARSSMAA